MEANLKIWQMSVAQVSKTRNGRVIIAPVKKNVEIQKWSQDNIDQSKHGLPNPTAPPLVRFRDVSLLVKDS